MKAQERSIRYRSLLQRYAVAIGVLVVVLGVGGGFLTYTAYGTTTTTTETRQVASWQSTGTFTHSATVVNDTAVYAEGDVLRNRTTYFRQLTPQLDGSFVYSYTATGGGDLTVDATTMLVLRSYEEGNEGEAVEYWRLDSELDGQQVSGLEPGERLRVPFSVNVTEARQRLSEVDDQFGSTPGQKQLRVESQVTISGTRNGESVSTTRTYALPISVSDSVYNIQDDGPTTASGSQTEQIEVTAEPGPLRAYGGPLAVVVAVALGVMLLVARMTDRFAVSDRERDWLAHQNTRSEFDDWLTTARIPDDQRDDRAIEVDSLEGLVDIAIDTDQRVLEDRSQNTLFVFDDNRTYVHHPPALSNGADAPDGDEALGNDDATTPGIADGLEALAGAGESAQTDDGAAEGDDEAD